MLTALFGRLIRWLEDSLSGHLREGGSWMKPWQWMIKSRTEKQRTRWSSLTRKCWLKMEVFLSEPHKHSLSYGFIPLNLLSHYFEFKKILTKPLLLPTTRFSCVLICSTVPQWRYFCAKKLSRQCVCLKSGGWPIQWIMNWLGPADTQGQVCWRQKNEHLCAVLCRSSTDVIGAKMNGSL